MDKKIIIELEENLKNLLQSRNILLSSFEVCQKIHDPKTFNELESVEAFTARFARTIDILIKKVFKTYLIFLKEDLITFIDSANFLEKLGILENADDFIKMKEIRNNISHEYTTDGFLEIFTFVYQQTPELFKIINKIEKEIGERLK